VAEALPEAPTAREAQAVLLLPLWRALAVAALSPSLAALRPARRRTAAVQALAL
jgi:hypothetical protein